MLDSSFEYGSLNSDRREIRVLELSPESFEEPLYCQLSTQSLLSPSLPIYNALSYVWGDPTSFKKPDNILFLDGHPFPVTTNLLSALRHLRPSLGSRPITLWVDAVSIDQRNVKERNQQVAMMRDVYASAERVIIWLGEECDGSDAVFDVLSEFSRQGHDERRTQYLSDFVQQFGDFFFGLPYRRPWFSRVWILQELVVAKQDPLVVCGRKSVPWSTLVKAWKAVGRDIFSEIGMVREKAPRENPQESVSIMRQINPQDRSGNDDIEILAASKIDHLDNLREGIRAKGGSSLRNLLLATRTSDSTDPRDRVYALLGLLHANASNSDLSITIDVDYSKPAAVVYTDAISHIFAQGEGPYFLSGSFLPGVRAVAPEIAALPSEIGQPHLPSWVPDLSRQMAEKATQPSGLIFHPPAGLSVSGVGAQCNNGRRLDDRTLQVEGLFVDTIEEVVTFGDSFDQVVEKLPDLEVLASRAKQLPCQFSPPIVPLMERFKNDEPLWRTLISNKRYMSGYDTAPSAYEEMYLRLLKRHATSNLDDGQQSEYTLLLKQAICTKSFFTTRNGFVGTCVPGSCRGDIIAILLGSPVPFVLRPISRPEYINGGGRQVHSLVGASYVSGIMGGEMVDELYCEDLMDSTTYFIQ